MIRNKQHIYGPKSVFLPASVNFGEFILNKLCRQTDRVALINGSTDECLTYGTIVQESVNFAVSLTSLGVGRGDMVALVTENRAEFWSTVVGVLCTGATVCPISVYCTTHEFKYMIDITKPKVVILSPTTYETFGKIVGSLCYVRRIIVYGTERMGNALLYDELAIAGDGRAARRDVTAGEFVPADVAGQTDVAFVLYSSGTTGLPKGVMVTHLNVIVQCSEENTAEDSSVELTVAPWFHARGLTTIFRSFTRGGRCVFLNKFKPDVYLRTIEKYKVTRICAVPAMLVALTKTDNVACDTSSLKIVFCGASPLTEGNVTAFTNRFPSVKAILQDYGSTETLGVTLNDDPKKFASVGPLLPHCVAKVVNIKTRQCLGPWEKGEICVKGLMVMKGYVGRERDECFDDEGFYRTGDIGYYDDEKYFYIVERLKDLIKYNGYQVPPAEIEMVLQHCEGVRDVGVVGVHHDSAGEVPMAFVVLKPGATVTCRDIQNFVAERLSPQKHLRGGVKFIDKIPRNPSGKILRMELRKYLKSISKL